MQWPEVAGTVVDSRAQLFAPRAGNCACDLASHPPERNHQVLCCAGPSVPGLAGHPDVPRKMEECSIKKSVSKEGARYSFSRSFSLPLKDPPFPWDAQAFILCCFLCSRQEDPPPGLQGLQSPDNSCCPESCLGGGISDHRSDKKATQERHKKDVKMPIMNSRILRKPLI